MKKCKGTPVTPAEVEKMLLLYDELGTYKKVGAVMRRHPDTVSRYVQAYKLAKTQKVINRV